MRELVLQRFGSAMHQLASVPTDFRGACIKREVLRYMHWHSHDGLRTEGVTLDSMQSSMVPIAIQQGTCSVVHQPNLHFASSTVVVKVEPSSLTTSSHHCCLRDVSHAAVRDMGKLLVIWVQSSRRSSHTREPYASIRVDTCPEHMCIRARNHGSLDVNRMSVASLDLAIAQLRCQRTSRGHQRHVLVDDLYPLQQHGTCISPMSIQMLQVR